MASGIVVEGLSKVYRHRERQRLLKYQWKETTAIHELNLTIPPGQIVGLLGLNGAGKTTTIKILSTLLLPSSGVGRVDDLDLVRDAATIRRRINMIVSGERMLYWRMTGRQNLWYFAQLYGLDRQIVSSRIDHLLRLVDLESAADTPVERYSKGMKQRLQIARGLINDPAYMFLDEPTLGLDAPIAREMRKMIQQLAQDGKGLLLTSHYLTEVEQLCSYLYVIHRGCLLAEGSPAQIKGLTRPNRVVRLVIPDLPPAAAHALNQFVVERGAQYEEAPHDDGIMITIRHPEDIAGQVATVVASAGTSLSKLELFEPTLEDAILELTGGGSHSQDGAYAGG